MQPRLGLDLALHRCLPSGSLPQRRPVQFLPDRKKSDKLRAQSENQGRKAGKWNSVVEMCQIDILHGAFSLAFSSGTLFPVPDTIRERCLGSPVLSAFSDAA